MAKYLQNQASFQISNLPDGLVFLFTAKPDSKFALQQLANLQEVKSQLENLNASVLFATDEEMACETLDYVLDDTRELVNLSPVVAGQKTLGTNFVVFKKTGENLEYQETKESPDNSNWPEAFVTVAENYKVKEPNDDNYYKWGQLVPETCEYLCIDCGFIIEFKEGQVFPICEVCFSGEPTGPQGPDGAYWEKV